MSLFGDSDADRRDYGFAFGAFKGAAYLGTIVAERGLLSGTQAQEFGRQMLDGIEIVPESQLSPDGRQAIEEMLSAIVRTASAKFDPSRYND